MMQTVGYRDIIMVVELHSGILGHASARRLDRSGWRVDQGSVGGDGAVSVAPVLPGVPEMEANARLEFLAAAVMAEPRNEVQD